MAGVYAPLYQPPVPSLSQWVRLASPQPKVSLTGGGPFCLSRLAPFGRKGASIAGAFARARTSFAALKAVADYTRQHSSIFVVDGPKLLDRSEKARRQKAIETVAGKIDGLAAAAFEGRAKYQEFESLLGELHAAGFYPLMSLISDVAHAMV